MQGDDSNGRQEPEREHREGSADEAERVDRELVAALERRVAELEALLAQRDERDGGDRQRSEERLLALNRTLERRVRARTAEAERRAAQLRALAAQLVNAEENERRRLADLLHDHVQQILTAARLRLRGLARELPPGASGSLDKVDRHLDECISVCKSLTLQLSPPIAIDQGLDTAFEWLSQWAASEHGLRVEVDVPEELKAPSAVAGTFLFQAVKELLFNVVKHSRVERATVRAWEAPGEGVSVEVTDSGVGFDPEAIPSPDENGGFGLFSMAERVELLGGQLAIESAPGGPTRVVVGLPGQPSLAGVEIPAERIRIVIVDDHRYVREGLTALIKQQPDMELVGEAGDGESACREVLRLRPDVVLMDVRLPRLDGIAATRRILAELPDCCIIGLSADGGDETVAEMVEAGAVNHFSKSGPPQTLFAAIRVCACADRAEGTRQPSDVAPEQPAGD